MSYLLVAPELLTSAATDLEGIASALSTANLAAAVPTTGMLAAGADEVSAAVASLFAGYGQAYQSISLQANAFQAQFIQAINGAGGAYVAAEAASTSPLQAFEDTVLGVINAPTQTLLGRPLIGDGAAGTVANPNGGAGGFLYGNGGNGFSQTTAGVAGGAGGQGGTGGMAGGYDNVNGVFGITAGNGGDPEHAIHVVVA
ncbi:PE family protein, partial [Mycobacterium ulcerans]